MEIGLIDLNQQWRVNSWNSKRTNSKEYNPINSSGFKLTVDKERCNSHEDK